MKTPFALVGLFAAAVSLAQAPKQPPSATAPLPPVGERVEVHISNVEVVVTDSKGNRVTDLTKNDFEVFQDGVPQTIENFYAVGDGKVTFGDGKSEPIDAVEARGELPTEIKARFILYIDNLNIQPQNRNRMFGKLKDFVSKNVGARAEAEVITFNRSLKVKRKFTADPTEILAALEDIERETGGGTSLAGERRDALHRIDESRSSDEALQTARQYARSLRNDLEFDVDALKSTLNALAGIKGRKIFVYVSEGLPATAGMELFDAVQKKYQQATSTLEAFEFDMSGKYAGVIQSANAQGVTIWALDASGLTVDQMITAENRSFENRPSDFLMRQNSQAPLQMLAEQTGGLASVNTNSWERSLNELAKDFSSFYSLGYRTSRSAVDRPHSLTVNVKRKGMRTRFRKSFLEKTPETLAAEAVQASLFYPRDDNPLGIHVTLGAQKPYNDENFAIPVRIAVPIGKLGLLPTGDRYEGTFFVYVIARDAAEKQSELAIQRQAVTVPAKDLTVAQAKDWFYDFTMTVGPGSQRIAFAVRDGSTGTTSYYQKNLFVSLLPKDTKKEEKPKTN
ncbi:MAG: VWA domain-containing protein [Acidobacteriota bacterium]|nr:VWA domain-containing protein [Acidobacteriota bacterium]